MEDIKINAIDYIKGSVIFTSHKYGWAIPLITKILNDDLLDNDIDVLVDSFLSKKKIDDDQVSSTQPASQAATDEEEVSDVGIKKIKSIDKILNIGLLDVKEPIEIKDGLNVFYGKNGAGKSSIYLGLCKVLGKNKRICSNITSKSDESCCQVTFESNDGIDCTLEWNSAYENEESKVMIFDSLISKYIVDQDQENQFEMAYLKMEYFSFLYDLYKEIESKLRFKLDSLNNEYDAVGQVLTEKAPLVFADDFDWDEKKVNKSDFSKEDKIKFEKLNGQIKTLEKDNPEAVVRNIENALEETKGVLSVFGEVYEEDDERGETVHVWRLSYDKPYFEEANKQIEKYSDVKKAFEDSGKNKISSLIPPEWIGDNTWDAFISSSINFLNSLDKEQLEKYTDETCVYCHQPLQTKEAKALVKAYQELHTEHKEKLDNEENKLIKMNVLMDECIKAIKKISTKNTKIEAEFGSISKKEKISYDFKNIKNIFERYKAAIDTAQKIEIDNADITAIEEFWDIYDGLFGKFKTTIDELNKNIANKDGKIQKLQEQIKPLQEKKSLFENKDIILKYLNIDKLKKTLSYKISIMPSLKRDTSSLKSAFADEVILKKFKKCLKDEYGCFNFSPSEKWSIAPATKGGVNKRVYSIRDRRLAEIFSEGEKKLHALSDFFAQCKVNKYKGVFIFDDPVNSLDEDNIEVVADRIIKLAEEGNQVIIFTHNLYFLNSIINTQKEKITKVERTNNQINLLKEIRIGETQELKDRLKRINTRMKDLSQKNPEKIDEYDMRNIYDLMSGYLEDYIEKVYFKNIISRYRPNIRMHTLGDLKDLDTGIINNVLELYDQTSRRGSRHSQPSEVRKPNYGELFNDVENLKNNFKYS